VLNTIRPADTATDASFSGTTAFQLLLRDRLQTPIVTLSEQLDDLLGGGLPIGKVTEFCMSDLRRERT
jgi:RecA/RadA recombinase